MPESDSSHDKAAAERLISLAEAAEMCDLAQDYLRRLVRTGKMWGTKIGRNWVTSEAAVKEYLATDRRPGPKPKNPKGENESS
jgi:excisionase family DNA binding protein